MPKMIDLTKLPADDAERIAYAEGFTGVGELFARIGDLEHTLHMMEEQNDPKLAVLDWLIREYEEGDGTIPDGLYMAARKATRGQLSL